MTIPQKIQNFVSHVAACTMRDDSLCFRIVDPEFHDNFQFGIVNPNNFGFRTALEEFNGPLGYFLNHVDDMVESIRK